MSPTTEIKTFCKTKFVMQNIFSPKFIPTHFKIYFLLQRTLENVLCSVNRDFSKHLIFYNAPQNAESRNLFFMFQLSNVCYH